MNYFVSEYLQNSTMYVHLLWFQSADTFYRWMETVLDLHTLDDFNTLEDAIVALPTP